MDVRRVGRVLAVLITACVAGCGSTVVVPPSSPPSPGAAAVTITQRPLQVASVAPAPTGDRNPEIVFAAPSPTPTRAPVVVRSHLRVPLSYSVPADWTVFWDTPTEVRLGHQPNPGVYFPGTPVVTIGIPYGFGSVSALLRAFKSRAYPSDASRCPGMAGPKTTVLGGLHGLEFSCWTEWNGDLGIYPKTRQGAVHRETAFDPADWYIIPKGGPFTDFLVIGVGGRPVIISIEGGATATRRFGPLVLDAASVAAFKSLAVHVGS